MSDPDDAALAFDADFARRAPHLAIAPETPLHRAALRDLMIACSPLGAALPEAMLDLQFQSQDMGFRAARPLAMRRVVLRKGQLAARIIIDWQAPGLSHGVDIAVHPDHRRSGAGLALLRAWIAVADAGERCCTLEVIVDNPARAIYRRLGFAEQPSDPHSPYLAMRRPVPARRAVDC